MSIETRQLSRRRLLTFSHLKGQSLENVRRCRTSVIVVAAGVLRSIGQVPLAKYRQSLEAEPDHRAIGPGGVSTPKISGYVT